MKDLTHTELISIVNGLISGPWRAPQWQPTESFIARATTLQHHGQLSKITACSWWTVLQLSKRNLKVPCYVNFNLPMLSINTMSF